MLRSGASGASFNWVRRAHRPSLDGCIFARKCLGAHPAECSRGGLSLSPLTYSQRSFMTFRWTPEQKQSFYREMGAFALLFTLLIGSGRLTASLTEEQEQAAIRHKRQLAALDSVVQSAHTVLLPTEVQSQGRPEGSDRSWERSSDTLPWDEEQLGRKLRRARLNPADVGLKTSSDADNAWSEAVSWTSVFMGKNWSSVTLRHKLQTIFSNMRSDMPLIGTGRSMSQEDEAEELERLQLAQMDDEKYAERTYFSCTPISYLCASSLSLLPPTGSLSAPFGKDVGGTTMESRLWISGGQSTAGRCRVVGSVAAN